MPRLLRTAAARFGSHTYLVANSERMTYTEADDRSASLAKGLLAEGMGKGSRIGILMPNSVEYAVAAFAITRIGAVFVPLNTFYQTKELAWTIRHADLTHVVMHPGFLTNDYLDRLEAAFPDLVGQSADGLLFLPDAPFLPRGLRVGCVRSIVVAGRRSRHRGVWHARGSRRRVPRRGRTVRRARRSGGHRLQLGQHRRTEGCHPHPGHDRAPLVQHAVGISDDARRRVVLVDAVLLDRWPGDDAARDPAPRRDPGHTQLVRRRHRARSHRAASAPPSRWDGRSRARRSRNIRRSRRATCRQWCARACPTWSRPIAVHHRSTRPRWV